MKKISNIAGFGVLVLTMFASVSYMVYLGTSLNSRVAAAYEGAYQESYASSHPAGHQAGYEEQYPVGYEDGYQDGLKDGHQKGYEEGHQDGMEDGHKEGSDSGYSSGIVEGHRRGYDEGHASGFIIGREGGYDEGHASGMETGRNDGLATHVDLHDPSYAEVKKFLRRDKTDSKPYIEDEYLCTDYSAEVINNAEAEGIRGAFVVLVYADEDEADHTIVAFNTTDLGLVFVEPQSDEMANPAVGKRWYQSIIPGGDYYYLPPSYDDTIEEIQIIW